VFSSRGRLTFLVARKFYDLGKVDREMWPKIQTSQTVRPIKVVVVGERQYWWFRHRFYWENDGLTIAQVYALLITRLQREQATIERAQAMVATGLQPQPTVRGAIPDDMKQLVWLRDGGRRRHCGSQVELQYDHVIPFSFGGATSPENLQILCGPCNRRKGSGLTAR
jgi:HNH endonuclease